MPPYQYYVAIHPIFAVPISIAILILALVAIRYYSTSRAKQPRRQMARQTAVAISSVLIIWTVVEVFYWAQVQHFGQAMICVGDRIAGVGHWMAFAWGHWFGELVLAKFAGIDLLVYPDSGPLVIWLVQSLILVAQIAIVLGHLWIIDWCAGFNRRDNAKPAVSED